MYQSYLLRVWYEDDEQHVADWQAEIQQIQSGESWTFSSREALLSSLYQLLKHPDDSEGQNRN
jgi:hypothetical protein